jgi:hypothetical protein
VIDFVAGVIAAGIMIYTFIGFMLYLGAFIFLLVALTGLPQAIRETRQGRKTPGRSGR